MFFAGLMLIALSFGMVAVGAAMLDTVNKQSIETYFFQTAKLSTERIGAPATVQDLSTDRVREMLTDKFITEYFYVIPDIKNIEQRKKDRTGLQAMVSADVFDKWLNEVAPEIEEMAQKSSLRTARLISMQQQKNSEQWWELKYELITWDEPNKLNVDPVVTQGSMYVRLRYEPGWKPKSSTDSTEMDIAAWLEAGKDPAYIFKFKIENIE